MLADHLAQYTRALCYDDLPAPVVHEVKRRLLDSLGCAFGAWNALLAQSPESWRNRRTFRPAPPCGAQRTKPAGAGHLCQWRHGPVSGFQTIRTWARNQLIPPTISRPSSRREKRSTLRAHVSFSPSRWRTKSSVGSAMPPPCAPKGGPCHLRPHLVDARRGQGDEAYGGAGAPGHQPGRSGEHRPATNQSRRPLDVGRPARFPTPHATACLLRSWLVSA